MDGVVLRRQVLRAVLEGRAVDAGPRAHAFGRHAQLAHALREVVHLVTPLVGRERGHRAEGVDRAVLLDGAVRQGGVARFVDRNLARDRVIHQTFLNFDRFALVGKTLFEQGVDRFLRGGEEKGEVKARVTGHYDPFYGVKITLPPIDKSDVARLVDRLAESPLIVARLAARELSPEIADIAESLGIRIFPTSWKDLEMSCTCPDWAVPCKHIAAAIYKLSEEIDANPFLLFTLRGIDLIAEMESRGVELEKAVEAEMPSWDDLIRGLDERGFVTDLHPDGESDVGWLEDLRKQTFRTFKVDGEKIRNLFAEHPAGYIHGDLRALTGRIVSEAGKLVAHQMRTVIERTIPEYDEARPLIAINTWGQPVVDESLF